MKLYIEILVNIVMYGILLILFIKLIYSKYIVFMVVSDNQLQLKRSWLNKFPIIIFPLWFIFLHSHQPDETIKNSNYWLKLFYIALFFYIIFSLTLEIILNVIWKVVKK